MKKNRDSSELAARITAAASQPAGMNPKPPLVSASPQPPAPKSVVEFVLAQSTPKKSRLNDQDTVAITLRPKSALWNKYVIKASERTREEGRVVSAQQIMLEALERVDL